MTYAIFFTWADDGTEDTFDATSAKQRDAAIKNMINRKEFSEISYQAKYKNGDRGKTIKVL
ncbi:MAG: hypothetical protein NC489_43400 [Ruminococcus flavefaciens]|nr:hypothetical protein [Ruminococcus flavefaciens]